MLSGATPFGFLIGQLSNRLQIEVNALETKGAARSLAEPNLVTLSGETASFLAGGQIPMMFGPATALLPLAQAGKIRALAVTSAKRSALAPELPTMAETLPGFEVVGWYGLAAPAGTPRDVIAKLNGETNGALQSPDLVAQMRELSYEPIGGTPDEASARIKADVARWTKAIHDAGIEPQ